MNFLQNPSDFCKKLIFALVIISIATLTAFGQRITVREEGKRYGDAGFVGEPINLNVVNADVRDILNYITEQYGINFVIDKSVAAVPVTVNVSDVPWNVALDSILQSQELAVQTNGPILRVASSKILAAETEIANKIRESKLDTSPLYTEIIRLNYNRAAGGMQLASTTTGTTGGGGGGGSVSGGGGGEGILPIIKRRLSRRGGIEVDPRSNTLIITDVRENIDAIRQLVQLLDQPEPQVEIEARIVVASRNFSRDIGVQLAGTVLGPSGGLASGSTLPGSSNTTGLTQRGVPSGLGIQPNNSLLSSIPNTVIGLTTGIFGTAQLSSLITAGEQAGKAKIIATPRVTVLNNRTADIQSGSKIPITTIQPGSGTGGFLVATTQYVDVPLRLAVTPQITDAGTIILNVVAENSSAAIVSGGAPPSINTQTMTTQVTVPDGGTTVVGGVLFDDERESQDRTPGLSSVPLLGNLFKRKKVDKNTNEILFFITPRITRMDYNGNPVVGTSLAKESRTTTIMQPVPLGNPPSNSETRSNQTPGTPVTTLIQPEVNPNPEKKP